MSRVLTRLLAALTAGLVISLTCLLSAAPAQAQVWVVPAPDLSLDPSLNLDEFENRLMGSINEVRVNAGLKPVRYFDSCVDQMAESWATRIATTGALEHRDQHIVLRRCDQAWAGEDLVRGSLLTPAIVVQAWMDSPSHREILLKKRASLAGLAISVDGSGRFVGVLNFTDKR
jgi:uncharacterized protein YkwD